MKPIFLSFKAFGPYVQKQEIDFEALEKSGLFLICGETGSGKTTILDAMCYALYGRSSGGLRGDITTMRCQLAEEKEDTEVEYVFRSGSDTYKFTRQLRFGRKNLNSFQNVLKLNSDGVFEPVYANPKIRDVEEMAEKLIGLNYEQFRQVIVLPQGQFEKLLTSNSEEKEKILVTLFGAEKWQKCAELVYDKALGEKRKIDEELSGIRFVLQDNGCNSPEELTEKWEEKKALSLQSEKEAKELASSLSKKREAFDILKAENQKFAELHETEKALFELESSGAEYEAKTKLLEKSNIALEIKPLIDSRNSANQRKKTRETGLENSRKEFEKAKSSLEALEQTAKKVEEYAGAYEAKKEKISQMKALIPVYENGEKLIDEEEKATLAYADAQKMFTKKEKDFSEKNAQYEAAKKNLSDEYSRCAVVYELYSKSISAGLSAKLKDGEPCPVCGSKIHPAPAKPEGRIVSEDEKNKAEESLEKAKKHEEKLSADLAKAREELDTSRAKLEASKASLEMCKERLAEFEKQKIKGVSSTDELRRKIDEAVKQVENYETQKKNAEEKMADSQRQYATCLKLFETAQTEFEVAFAEFEKTEKVLSDTIEKHGFGSEKVLNEHLLTPEQKQELISKIEKHKNDMQRLHEKKGNLEKELSGKEKPGIADAEKAISDEERIYNEKIKLSAVLKSESERLGQLCKEISAKSEKNFELLLKCEENLNFAKKLRGDIGIGLQRYVLAVMLSAVTAEANKLLAEVHGGRYRLFRTSSTASGRTRKSGLELEVSDSFSGERRSVVSLSGGEKFLAALSLSIGLSALVSAQSGGTKLEAMFIDEGFGSLDPTSVADALAVLSHVKNAKGSVGIISHVDILKETIGTRVEITKGRKGSNCRMITDK